MKLALVLILTVLVAQLLFIVGSDQTRSNKLSPKPIQIAQNFDWKVPPIPTEFDWETRTVLETSEEASSKRVFWDRRFALDPKLKNESGEVSVGGKIYEIRLPNDHPQYDGIENFLNETFYHNLIKLGWTPSITYAEWDLNGMAADGVFGSTRGFIKMDGTTLRTVVYSYNTEVTSWDGPLSQVQCPCTKHVTLFISEPIDLSNEIPGFIKE